MLLFLANLLLKTCFHTMENGFRFPFAASPATLPLVMAIPLSAPEQTAAALAFVKFYEALAK